MKTGKLPSFMGNRDRKPACTIPDQVCRDILCLYDTKYEGANLLHFTELLKEHEGICVPETFVRNLLPEEDIPSPKARKSTIKQLKKRLQNKQAQTKSKKKQEAIQIQKRLTPSGKKIQVRREFQKFTCNGGRNVLKLF